MGGKGVWLTCRQGGAKACLSTREAGLADDKQYVSRGDTYVRAAGDRDSQGPTCA